ncbi:hypothetical protein BGZ47_005291 [Haplosporangium gracile]|nr:hypothetical protein BGZ47_005291 [Haplosporangium gracile]
MTPPLSPFFAMPPEEIPTLHLLTVDMEHPPRSTYGALQAGQQKGQQQQGGIPVSRSSSMHSVHGSQMPRPQRALSGNKGNHNGIPSNGASTRSAGLRHHQSDASLLAAKRLSRTGDQPNDMEQIYSEAQALAQRLSNSSSSSPDPRAVGGITRATSTGIRALGVKSGSGIPSSSSSSSISRIAAASSDGASMLRRPTSIPVPNSPSSTINVVALPPKSSHRLSIPSKLPSSSSASSLKQRASLSIASASSRQDIKQISSLSREQDTPSPTRIPGSPSAIQQTSAARKLAGLQQSSLVARPNNLRQSATDSQISTALLPTLPMSTSNDSGRAAKEMEEELERWKIEVRELRQERVATDGWRKQISDLERDLETALDSLQSAEAKVIELRSEQQSTAAAMKDHEDAQEKLAAYELTVDQLEADIELIRGEKEKALEDAATNQKEQLVQLESRNQELEQKLTQAQQDIEQLELQAAPLEVQEVQQSLFSATQDLEESKLVIEKLKTELAEEKAKIAREQEDAGQLLVKLSQLQDTIANQLRENNSLKEVVKDHEKCTENAETVEYQHKKEIMRLQKEIADQQKALAQEKEQKTKLEMVIQEHQYQSHQFQQQLQQQLQLQQTQLLQQQTEIVNLRVSLEVEQNQSALWQRQHQEEQRLNHASSFGRRVSLDHNGDINGSFTMGDSSTTLSSAVGVPTGIPGAGLGLMNMGLNLNMGVAIGGVGSDNKMSSSPLTSTPPAMVGGPLGGQGIKMSMLSNQINMSNSAAAALPPGAQLPPMGGMASAAIGEVEVKPRMIHRGSSGSVNGINRHSMHGDIFFGSASSVTAAPAPGPFQTVDELTAQLHGLMKEKERLQADLSKIPISGGGPMMRRKAEMLEEQMDETERMMSKIRYSIRMRS